MKVQFVAKEAKVNHVTEQRAANSYEKLTLSDSDSKNSLAKMCMLKQELKIWRKQ